MEFCCGGYMGDTDQYPVLGILSTPQDVRPIMDEEPFANDVNLQTSCQNSGFWVARYKRSTRGGSVSDNVYL